MKIFNKLKYAVLSLLIAGSVSAQDTYTAFGLKAGFTRTQFTGSGFNAVDAKSNFALGVFAQKSMVGKVLFFQPEVLYVNRGSTINLTADNKIREEIDVNYLQIPLLVKLRLPLGMVKPHILAGPAFAFKMNGTYARIDDNLNLNVSSDDDINNFDLSAIAGAGVDLEGERLILTIEGRYDLGAGKVIKRATAPELKSTALGLFLGVGFKM